ncbi:MAG: FliO/MopB family protein [Bacteriovoracaceae bacterium]|nr:FliO/MopB family protein [Bacteriovoracaceae bacterium]
MKNPTLLLLLSLLLFSFSSFAGEPERTKIKSINFSKVGKKGQVIIKLENRVPETPELVLKKGIVQVELPGTYVWPKIEKKVTTSGKDFDTTITAYQFNKDTVRFRAMIPFSLNGKENQVNVTLREKAVVLNFPLPKQVASKKVVTVTKTPTLNKKPKSANNYDESYLDKLVREKTTAKKPAKLAATKGNLFKKKDEVNMTLSAGEKEAKSAKSSFSVASYIGKFVAFLGLILVFFYGVVHLMRKGVIKKGKLGFLNDTNIVEILNTTYLGPKKSLLMVKVHKQVFLLSSTDKGVEFLSEVNDTTGLFKSQEDKVSGNNFDSSLTTANGQNKEFKLKELGKAIAKTEEAKEEKGSLEGFLAKTEEQTEDKVKLSDQIKSKVKNLKQLQ